jgi:hypothetical protein
MADNIEITLKPTVVKPDNIPSVDYDALYNDLSVDQKAIANKIFDEAERQGVDANLMLSIAHIENRFNTGASPKGALGPMQLMPGTAKDLNVDPNDIDQNIAGGITYYKQMLDKYKDPYVAGIAYNAGPGVADNFLKTDDLNDLPLETKNYIEQLDRLYKVPGAVAQEEDVGDIPEITIIPTTPTEENNDLRNKAIAGTITGAIAAKANEGTRQKMIDVEAEQSTPKERARAKLRSENADIALKEKSKTATGRLTNQQSLVQDAEKRMASWDKAFTKAQDRLAAAEELARKLGIVEENVKTSPGGVTQKGGLGSGAMKHSNVMGEVHEANVVRKGTEATGSGWQQKSRLIVPEKYAATSSLSTEQLLAQKNLEKAQRDYRQAQKDLSVAKSTHAKESGKLTNLSKQTEQHLSQAEENLNIAKEQYKNVASKKAPGMFTRVGQQVGKSIFGSVIPGAAAGVDLEDARQRYNRGDIPGAVISGIGGVGGAMSMIPPIPPIGTVARLIGGLTSMVAPMVNYYRDSTATEDEQATANAPKYAAGGAVKKFEKGGLNIDKIDLANSSKYIDGSSRENNPYGYVLDDSNSRMDVSPRASLDSAVISDRANIVHNMVAERDRLTDKYLGSTGRLSSKGLEYLRTALDKAPSFTGKTLSSMGIDPNYVPVVGSIVAASRPTRESDVVNGELKIGTDFLFGQLPETLYDYTTSGQPGFVRGGKWVPSPATGGMMYENVYGDVNAFDFLNLAGMQVPFVKAGKAAYKAASPLLRKVMNPPVAVMESTSPGLLQNTYRMRNTGELANDPAGLELADERAQEALRTSGLGNYNVETGQGAWGGNKGIEFNRAYSVKLPRKLGPLSDYNAQLAQFGSDTDQEAMSVVRFVPQKKPAGSTAIKVNNVTEKDIVTLGKILGEDVAIQHRPQDGSAVIFNFMTDSTGDIEHTLYNIYGKDANKKFKFGTYESSLVDKKDYPSYNVNPKTPKLVSVEQKARSHDARKKK